MQEIDEHLRRVEERLERLLAAGRRNADADRETLAADADSLETLGLTAFAADVRTATQAEGALSMLAAATRALAACHLLRARVPADTSPYGDWQPLAPPPTPKRKRAPSPYELIPIGRMLVGGAELWVCVAGRRGVQARLILLEPLPAEQMAGAWPLLPPPDPEVIGSGETPPWLCCRARGRLRWRGRYPLGAAGDIQRCALLEPVWLPLTDSPQTTAQFLRPLRDLTKDREGLPLLGESCLRLTRLCSTERRDYVWLDASAEAAFAARGEGEILAIAWVQGPLVVPLALIELDGASRPRLTHLLPGNPSDLLSTPA